MKIKNRIIIVALAFLFITSLQVLVNLTYGTCAEQRGKSSETYPTTPEGVVEAYCRASFDAREVKEIVYGGDVKERIQYTTLEGLGGCDGFPIAVKYTIIKIGEYNDEAKVKVVYECIGDISALEFLKIGKKTKEIVYQLKKNEGMWKIVSPFHCPYISVKAAIELSKYGMKINLESKEQIKKNIYTLEKYL